MQQPIREQREDPKHFTYTLPDGDLHQGDILRLTDELKSAVGQLHPPNGASDSKYLIVITQCCDLARRPEVKAQHIALAPVYPLTSTLERELAKEQKSLLAQKANVCRRNRKQKLTQFLMHLMNNNNPDLFYLHDEPGFGLFESCCALLRLSVAIPTGSYYQPCLDARILSLREVWRAKLGWVTGHIYSRVGTPDWAPDIVTEERFHALIEDILTGVCKWVDDEKLAHAEKNPPKDLSSSDTDALRQFIDEAKVQTKRDVILSRFVKALVTLGTEVADVEGLCATLRADTTFQQYTK